MKFTHGLLGLLFALSLVPLAVAASLEGQSFQDRVTVAGSELGLNGLGLRAVSIVKAYVVALYLPQPTSSERVILEAPGAKRIEIRMLRSASATDFNRALLSGLRKNLQGDELARLHERIDQLEASIEAIGQVRKDDRIAMDFDPQRGLLLGVNGQARGEPIAGADFYQAVLRIFVGEHPVDAKLKRGLLGLAAAQP